MLFVDTTLSPTITEPSVIAEGLYKGECEECLFVLLHWPITIPSLAFLLRVAVVLALTRILYSFWRST